MAKISLLGTIGADAKVNQVSDERMAINFSVCENIPVKGIDGTTVYQPQWYNVSYFTRSDKMGKYLLKGKKVFVSGTLKFNEFKNAQTGMVMKVNDIIADTIEPAAWDTEVSEKSTGLYEHEI
jgi:single stranded DNA-binding protein